MICIAQETKDFTAEVFQMRITNKKKHMFKTLTQTF